MSEKIDARGLSCPQPVLLATNKMKSMQSGKFEIIADCGVSPENIERAVNYNGWQVSSKTEENNEVKMIIEKK